MRILVIEDNRGAADSLGMLLRLAGFEVAVAYDGKAGVRAGRETHPEVVLSHINMPGLDGFGVAKALRREPATKQARLIAISALSPEQHPARLREAGFQRTCRSRPTRWRSADSWLQLDHGWAVALGIRACPRRLGSPLRQFRQHVPRRWRGDPL